MPGARVDSTTPSPFLPSSWLPDLRAHTARTRVIDIPSAFLSALLQGGVHSSSESVQPRQIEWSDGTVDTLAAVPRVEDPFGVQVAIESAIAELNGAVCPKFDTVCPVDATWANFDRSTKCTCAEDVLTLLQSSERVLGSVNGDVQVALRQWADMDERMEFRSFVRRGEVVAVSQRVAESRIEYAEDEMDRIVESISNFCTSRVVDRFQQDKFVMDVYIDRQWRVWIVDFSAWGESDALLFEWDELEDASWMTVQQRAQFRCAVRHGGIRPSQRVFDGLPLELRGASGGLSLVEAARRLMEEQEGM